MAYWLVEEVLDHAPRHLTRPERHLLVVLAEFCRGNGRSCAESLEHIAWRYGGTPSGVKQVLRKLAESGVDVRVAIGEDRHGGPVYAVRGRVPQFRLPEFPAPRGCPCRRCRAVDSPVDNSTEGGSTEPPCDQKGAELSAEGGSTQPPKPPEGGSTEPPSRSSPGDPVSLSPRARDLAREIGASEEEMTLLIEQAKTAGARAPVPWLRRLHDNGDLAPRLAALRDNPPIPLRPPWCGHCDQATRQVELPDGRPARCGTCHPLRSAS